MHKVADFKNVHLAHHADLVFAAPIRVDSDPFAILRLRHAQHYLGVFLRFLANPISNCRPQTARSGFAL